MKIAICLSGQLRTFRDCLPGIMRFFEQHDVDFFFHTWLTNDWMLSDKDKAAWVYQHEAVEPADIHSVINALKPKKYKTDQTKHWDMAVSQSQQYSALVVNSLKCQYELEQGWQYDCVVKCRFDLVWHPKCFFTLPDEYNYESLYVTDYPFCDPANARMTLDRFYFGSSTVMNAVADLFYETKRVLAGRSALDLTDDEHWKLSPELFLHTYLNNKNISQVKHHLYECIVRKQSIGLHHIDDYDTIMAHSNKFYE